MTRCSLCPGINKCLPPDGPEGAEILFVGEAPGRDEQSRGQVFVGRAGDELNGHYLPLAGLRRFGIRLTNVIRCMPDTPKNKLDPQKQPHLDLMDSCANRHLYPVLERSSHIKLIVPLGGFAVRAICPEVDLERQHGFPVDTIWGIPAFPMYHPNLAMHEPKKMLHLRNDWMRLKAYLRGHLRVPVDLYPNPDYQEITRAAQLDIDPGAYLAGDTEFTKTGAPYCFTYSQQPGHARLIRAERADLFDKFQRAITGHRGPILFHNWPADAPIVHALGLRLPHARIVDTMVRVFHLGNLPQGLKNLVWRELGVTMQEFTDIVHPHSYRLAREFFERVKAIDWPKPEEQLLEKDTGGYKLYKPQGLNTKLKRLFTDAGKNPDIDWSQRWKNWEPHHAEIEAACGEFPGVCISHAPFEEVLPYACADADMLGRLWPLLQRMRRNVRKKPQEDWRAA